MDDGEEEEEGNGTRDGRKEGREEGRGKGEERKMDATGMHSPSLGVHLHLDLATVIILCKLNRASRHRPTRRSEKEGERKQGKMAQGRRSKSPEIGLMPSVPSTQHLHTPSAAALSLANPIFRADFVFIIHFSKPRLFRQVSTVRIF